MPSLGELRPLERESEFALLNEAVSAAAGGEGQLVIVEAPAGLGKTTLLDAAVEAAKRRGMMPLRARGSHLERDFAFGLVRQLLEPVIARSSRQDREKLFSDAAALAEPLFEDIAAPATAAPTDAMYRMLHGLYWLFVNLTADAPVAAAVDDAHWGDSASLRFLAFLQSRLAELPFVLLIALRSGAPDAERAPLAALAGAPDAVVLQPRPLSSEAVAELLAGALNDEPEPTLTAACQEVTAGNPFYLHALVRELAAIGDVPRAGLATRVRSLGPRSVSRSVLLGISTLDPAAPALARAAAVVGEGAALEEVAALAQLPEDEAARIADQLVQAAVLKRVDRLEFVHPIVAEAIYADLPPHRRAAEHARAAEVLRAVGAAPERVAAQLLHSKPARDVAALETLERAADDAIARGAPEAAIAFLQRALEERSSEDRADGVLFRLGVAGFQAGRLQLAVEHLARVAESDADVVLRADAGLLLARALAFAQRQEDAVRALDRAIVVVAPVDRERALQLEAELIAIAQMDVLDGDLVARRFDHLPAWEAIEGRTRGERELLSVCAFQALRENRPARTVVELGRRGLQGTPRERVRYSLPVAMAETALLYAEDYDFLGRWLDERVDDAGARGAATDFAGASHMLAGVARARGDIREAETHLQAAMDALDSPAAQAILTAFRIQAMLERGDVPAAADALDRCGLAAAPADKLPLAEMLYARALLRGAEGDRPAELQDLLACGRLLVRTGSHSPAAIPWRSRAALACLALGDRDRARRLATEEVELARAFGSPRPLGIALRAAGLVEGGAAGLGLLREAVSVLESSAARLELARVLVDLGAALRRAGQRTQARTSLRRGHELAGECGADALTARAATELQASGEHARRQHARGADALTPSERRVATMAAAGLSNPQIAQALFVSLKTVETHLAHAYRKLGIRSRGELGRML